MHLTFVNLRRHLVSHSLIHCHRVANWCQIFIRSAPTGTVEDVHVKRQQRIGYSMDPCADPVVERTTAAQELGISVENADRALANQLPDVVGADHEPEQVTLGHLPY